MKWLLLLIVVSCGRHQEPPPHPMLVRQKPVKEPNQTEAKAPAIEASTQDLVREIRPVKSLGAQLTFWNGRSHETVELIANTNTHDIVKNLLVKNKRAIHQDDLNPQRSFLRLHSHTTRPELDSPRSIEIQLVFDRVPEERDEILLIQANREISRLKWQKQLKLTLTGYELNSLLNGNLRIAVEKKESLIQSHNAQTYRVYKSDGFEANVLEISEELSFEDYLSKENIDAHEISEVDLLSIIPHDQMKKWWKRKTPFGFSLGYFSLNELKSTYLNSFKLVSTQIGRKEGASLPPMIIKKDPEARVFFKIRPVSHVTRQFVKSTVRTELIRFLVCTQEQIKVAKEVSKSLTIPSMITHIEYREDGRRSPLSQAHVSMIQTKDQSGAYLYVIPKNHFRDMELHVGDLSKKQFTAVGIYGNSCAPGKLTSTSNEKQLMIKVETFVEKL